MVNLLLPHAPRSAQVVVGGKEIVCMILFQSQQPDGHVIAQIIQSHLEGELKTTQVSEHHGSGYVRVCLTNTRAHDKK